MSRHRRCDSRSRSPLRSQRRHPEFSSGRSNRHRSRTRSPRDERGSVNLPRSWRQTSQEWDSNKLYGLSLPKNVLSNRLTRELGIAGMDIFDVPLSKIVSGGATNWALRQVAHGRTVHWENFRSKQEGVFCGVLMRALRSDQSEQDGTDFVTILNATQKKLYPDSELHDWPIRYKTIQKLAEDVVKDFRKKAPTQTNQTLLMRLHALESENARLKGEHSRSDQSVLPRHRGTPSRRPSRAEPASSKRALAPVGRVEDIESEGEDDRTAHFRSPVDDPLPDEDEAKDDGPIAAQDTYSQYLPNRDSTLYLESCTLEGLNIKSVNNWLASTPIGKGKNKVIDTAVSEFVAACAKLDDGSKKPVDKIAVEWGLSVPLASKLNVKCLTRLIAGAHVLANQ